ncbi:MAG: hypothetical protein ACREEW_06385, partial [Caulobacteraceae bacterium]
FLPPHSGKPPQTLNNLGGAAGATMLLLMILQAFRAAAGAAALAASYRRPASSISGASGAGLIQLTAAIGAQQFFAGPWSKNGGDSRAPPSSFRTLVSYQNKSQFDECRRPASGASAPSDLPDRPLQIVMQVDGKAMAKIMVKHLNAWLNTNRAAGAAFDSHASFSQMQLSAV